MIAIVERDNIAVLNSAQHVYVAIGDSRYFKSNGNYANWTLDRRNINADTGATLCIKGIYATIGPFAQYGWVLMAHGCDGQLYASATRRYVGWLVSDTRSFKDIAGGYGYWSALTSTNLLHTELPYNLSHDMAMPGRTIKAVGDAYAIATTNEVAQLIHANPPYFVRRTFEFPESGGSLGQIDSGYRFRNNSGEFFVWHNYYRVYLYAP